MKITCEIGACDRTVKFFHTVRGIMVCATCSGQFFNEVRQLMPVVVGSSLHCFCNECTKPVTCVSPAGNYVCSEHTTLLAFPTRTRPLAESDKTTTFSVEVTIGNTSNSGWDIMPLIEVSNSLGQRGFGVSNVIWADDRGADSGKILLVLNDSGVTKNQITLLEQHVKELKSQLRLRTTNYEVTLDKLETKKIECEQLAATIESLKESYEDGRLRWAQLLADGRIEDSYIPILTQSQND